MNLDEYEYLNIGCGNVRFPNCINMDIVDNVYTYVDIVGNVLNIPFPDKRFKGVIFCHVLEHLYQKDHFRAMQEIRRVLKPNGKLFLECPDLNLVCKYFLDNFQGRGDYWYMCIYGRCLHEGDAHKSGITQEYLTDLLFTHGFGHLNWKTRNDREPTLIVVAEKLEKTLLEKI
jgi:SAM-dependent methyltransferase